MLIVNDKDKSYVPRINQLDAATLDEEVFTTFSERLGEAFKYFLRFLQIFSNICPNNNNLSETH